MKRRPVVYLLSAQRDLLEIFEYIKSDSPKAAKDWLDRIDGALGRLVRFPESGTIPKDERLAVLGYRIILIGEYLAFYVSRGGRIEIRRILHGRRKYSFLL